MEPYDTNTGVHNRVQITIDLNELVWARGEHLKQEMSVNQTEYLAETLRRTLTWDTMYGMIDQVILEFFDNHEHPEIWDPHYGETAGEEPAATFEKQAKEREKAKKEFEMVDLVSSAWTIKVPRRIKK
jgi:pyrroloquinoline quinone (PQQ) biosynthesis protein C